MIKGKYIVLEGPEGVGKTTQLQELSRRLRAAGLPVLVMREPGSHSDLTSRAIRHLTQDPNYPMNTRTEVLLYNAARSQSLQVIKKSVDNGVFCLVDRNYLTTLAIQYYGRGDVPDYDIINSIISFAVNGVEPDLCIVLDAPVAELRKRLSTRHNTERFDNLDDAFLERVRAGYLWEANRRNMPVVFATDSPEVVSESIWQLVSKALAMRESSSAQAVSAPASVKEIIEKQDLTTNIVKPQQQSASTATPPAPEVHNVKANSESAELTSNAVTALSDYFTSPTGDVYIFTGKVGPLLAADALSILKLYGDNTRTTILNKLAASGQLDLADPVSAQPYIGFQFVAENSSRLLSKKMEWGRLSSYAESNVANSYYDKKDAESQYKYFTPENFSTGVKKQYRDAMNTLFGLYGVMVAKLSDHLMSISDASPTKKSDPVWQAQVRHLARKELGIVLPVAAKTNVGFFASLQSIENLVTHLLSDPLPEAQNTGRSILDQTRKIMPDFLNQASSSDIGEATIKYRTATNQIMKKVTKEYLPANHASSEFHDITLVDFWPKNEMLLVPDMLYEHSNQSLEDLQAIVNGWPYDKKISAFKSYIGDRTSRHLRPGRAIEKAHYSWDLVTDYSTFYDLQRFRMVEDLNWQQLTPRFGYSTPKIVDDAALNEQFEACFDISLKLYSTLQQAGYQLEAQYATLLGHKMRWKVTYNAREAFLIHEHLADPKTPLDCQKLINGMHEKLTEAHPLLAEAMKYTVPAQDLNEKSASTRSKKADSKRRS
jgi:dTMP kinase